MVIVSFGETAAHFIIKYPWDRKTKNLYILHLTLSQKVRYSVINLSAPGTQGGFKRHS